MSIGYALTLDFKESGSPAAAAYSSEVSAKAQVKMKRILRRAAVFGPNAAGKTALLKSIACAKRLIIEGLPKPDGFTQQFAGPLPELKGTSFFEFTLYINDGVYNYGFVLDREKFCEEWLERIFGDDEVQPLFVRRTDRSGSTEIELAEKYFPQGSACRKDAEFLVQAAADSLAGLLFLSKLKDLELPEIKAVYDWFYQLQVIFPHSNIIQLPNLFKSNQEITAYLKRTLAALDLGIAELKPAAEPLSLAEAADRLKLPRELLKEGAEAPDSLIFLGGRAYLTAGSTLREVKFIHQLQGTQAAFSLSEESAGTRRLIELLPVLFRLSKGDSLCCVDDFERSLHPKLSLALLDELLGLNNRSQLIFTSHEVSLINSKHLHPDEIWFMEKSAEGASRLQPLSDFDLSRGQDPLKSYLAGRFGAVPRISPLCDADEE